MDTRQQKGTETVAQVGWGWGHKKVPMNRWDYKVGTETELEIHVKVAVVLV